MTKLIDALHGAGYPVSGACPGFAQDLPEELRPLVQFKISAEYSRFGGWADLPTIAAAEYVRRMSDVMGQPFSLSLYMFSPLRMDEDSLARILHFLDRGVPLSLHVSAMPSVGGTTPLPLPGALVQSAAEILAGFTMLKLVAGDRTVEMRIQLFPFDMKYANIALGSAEEALLAVVAKEVTDFYCGEATEPNGYLFGMGKLPNQQTAAEKMAQAVYKALVGTRTFTCGGATASTVFSPEQLVVDCEIVNYVSRTVQGYEFDDLEPYLDIIKELSESGRYLEHETTVRNHRAVYWMPALFEHSTFQQWQGIERGHLSDQAKATAVDMISRHDFHLDEDRRQALDRIYEEAKAQVLR